eukprot:2325281-Pyramimonas_sp.AAC.1
MVILGTPAGRELGWGWTNNCRRRAGWRGCPPSQDLSIRPKLSGQCHVPPAPATLDFPSDGHRPLEVSVHLRMGSWEKLAFLATHAPESWHRGCSFNSPGSSSLWRWCLTLVMCRRNLPQTMGSSLAPRAFR